ncbi:MAG: C10 family peptidase [Rikenellaceae bacterium]|nr:C10 family peptidase [Rikenellaceae bacterium]
MKRFLIILESLLLSVNSIYAESIGEEKAMKIAKNFFGQQVSQKIQMIDPDKTIGNQTRSTSNDTPYFIINNANGGFVIVSNSSSTIPILAYSYENTFNIDNVPENIDMWLNQLSVTIEKGRDRVPSATITEMWKSAETNLFKTTSSNIKLNTAQWNQWAPFNNMCPGQEGYDEKCPTGCLSTALAIIMRYWEWPKAGVGTLPKYSYWQESGSIGEGWQEGASHGGGYELGYEYDWDSMPLDNYEQFTDSQQDAVALLMKDCGAVLQTCYTIPFASAAAVREIENIKEYFNYDKAFTLRYASNYNSYNEWAEVLKTEIREQRPILAAGGFHAYVIDGYDENGYFSINWGWGGDSNGYYLMDPYVSEGEGVYENFITQQAYVGLQPSVEGENKYLLEWNSGNDYLSIRNNCYDLLQPFSLQNICLSIRNLPGSDSNYYGDYVAAIMNEAGELKTFISEEQRLVGGFIDGEIENCIIKERPDVGDYITILFRSKGYDEWEEVLTHSYSDNARVYLNESESLEDNTSIVINPNEELFKLGYVELMTKLLTIKTMSGTSLKIYRSDGTMVEYDDGAKPLRIVNDVDFSSLIHCIFLSNLEPGTYTIVLQHSLQKKEIIIII